MSAALWWSVIIGFLSGVALREYVPSPHSVALFLSLIGCAFIVCGYAERAIPRWMPAALFLIALAIGVARADGAVLSGDPLLSHAVGSTVTIVGKVIAEPDQRTESTRVALRARSLMRGSERVDVDAGVLLILPAHAPVSYGDSIVVSGSIRAPEAFETSFGRSFDYPGYLAVSGMSYELKYANLKEVVSGGGNPFTRGALWVKHAYLSGLGRALPEPESGLAAGITVGDKRGVGELAESFQKVGLTHVLVLSGYNITIVMNGALFLAQGAPRAARFGVGGLIALFFAAISGGASSAVRAAGMSLIAVYARMSGREVLALRALGATAALMVLWEPLVLLHDPGFQLSVLAMLGLVLFTPIAEEHLAFLTARGGLREIAASTIGTQTAVLPLLLYSNGQLPLVSLPANLFALIAVPFAMLFSAVAAVAGAMFAAIAPLFAFPAFILLKYILSIAVLFSSVPYASVGVPPFSVWWVAIAYVVMFGSLALKQLGFRHTKTAL